MNDLNEWLGPFFDRILARTGMKHLRRFALAAPAGTALLAGIGLVPELLSIEWRIALIVVGVLLLSVGIIASGCRQRAYDLQYASADSLARQLDESRAQLERSSPERTLDSLALVLFRMGGKAWRLGIYVTEEDADGVWWLRRVLRRSGSEAYEGAGRTRIPLDRSVLRELMTINLGDSRAPFANQTGEFPDREVNPREWKAQQVRIVGDEAVADALRMPSRKYAWCATRDTVTRQTVIMVAECVDPSDLIFESLSSSAIAELITLLARNAEIRTGVAGPMAAVTDHLRRPTGSG